MADNPTQADTRTLAEYKLVITPAAGRKAWLSSWDTEDRGPQIRRASFFPSEFTFSEQRDVAVLHAVKNSEGLLAKEFVILSQKLHRGSGSATRSTQARPRRAESLSKHIFSKPEQLQPTPPGSRRQAAIPRTQSEGQEAFAEDPQIAAILRASNSGSHYLLASCTRKEAHSTASASPFLEATSNHVDQAASTEMIRVTPVAPPVQSAPSVAPWRRRVFAPAPGAFNCNISHRAAGEKRKKEESQKAENLGPAPEAARPTEMARCPGSPNGVRQRRAAHSLRPGSWRSTETYQMLEGPQSDDLPSPVGGALLKASNPSYWLAARRHSLLLSACWTGSAYDLASEAESPRDTAVVVETEGRLELPALQGLSHDSDDESSESEAASGDMVLRMEAGSPAEEPEWQPSCFSVPAMYHCREHSPPHSRPRRTHPSLSWSPESRKDDPPEGDGASAGGHLTIARFQGLRGVSLRRASPPKEKPSNAFVGTPELAIRFFRPGMAGRRFMAPSLRAMGPGEGFVPTGPRNDWVMEGIPTSALKQLAALTGLGGERVVDEGGITTQVQEDSGLLVDVDAPASTFMGEPGDAGSGCAIAIYGSSTSRPALQMFREVAANSRCVTFSVKIDETEMTALQAFAYCLARTDSMVAGGLRSGDS